MKIAKFAAVALATLATGFASQASATVFTYDLLDKTHSTYGNGGFFGYTGKNPRYDTYSFEDGGAKVTLSYDDVAGTAKIDGIGFNRNTGQQAAFNLFYDDITQNGGNLSFNDMDVVGSIGTTKVRGKGFNISLLNDTLTGSGWLAKPNGKHFGDFHLAGVKTKNDVPVPAPLTLIGAAALLGAWRRRRSTAG